MFEYFNFAVKPRKYNSPLQEANLDQALILDFVNTHPAIKRLKYARVAHSKLSRSQFQALFPFLEVNNSLEELCVMVNYIFSGFSANNFLNISLASRRT